MRALLSVSDKSGIVEFARGLEKLGWEIVSTGGTYRKLSEAGVKVVEIDEVTKLRSGSVLELLSAVYEALQ